MVENRWEIQSLGLVALIIDTSMGWCYRPTGLADLADW
jgi:hypothetical protein